MTELKRGQDYFIGHQGVFLAWPDEKKGPFLLEAQWAEDAGRPICVGLTIWKGVVPQTDPPHTYSKLRGSLRPEGLGGTDLRSIPLAAVLERLWELQQERSSENKQWWTDVALTTSSETFREDILEALAVPDPLLSMNPRRRQADDLELFTKVAEVYRAAFSTPGRKRPTKAVENHFRVSYSTATKWVHRARELGLLPPTTPGKSAGIKPSKTRSKKGAR